MRVSIVVRTKDEAPRLRLTLASLARQMAPAEVVVVNDGSSDATDDVLREASERLQLTVVSHAMPRGRSAASNAGARVASGDILLFLDGDTLASPDLVALHLGAHAARGRIVARGETFHVRGTRLLKDPETGEPWPETAAHLARMLESERTRLRVTRRMVEEDFPTIERMAMPGNYPGVGPRRLFETEIDALERYPDCSVLWAASSGSNLSVARSAFLDAGGFHEDIDNSEHRELALRLCRAGAQMSYVKGARTYHLTHRSGWRDPLKERSWEAVFLRAHPIPEVKLLAVMWASLSSLPGIPSGAEILSLPELEAAARGNRDIDYDDVRRALFAAVSQPTAIPGLV